MKRVVASIPVHENISVIVDQLENYRSFVPSFVGIVLHVSNCCSKDFFEKLISLSENEYKNYLFINPERLNVTKGNWPCGLTSLFCSNFNFIKEKIDFDLYYLSNSNDMFVKAGVETIFDFYESGVNVLSDNPLSDRSDVILFKPLLETKFKQFHSTLSFAEGSFYPKEKFDDMQKFIFQELLLTIPIEDLNLQNGLIGGQEYLFTTIFYSLFPELFECRYKDKILDIDISTFEYHVHNLNEILSGRRNAYAIKRVPRSFANSLRCKIRNLSNLHKSSIGQKI